MSCTMFSILIISIIINSMVVIIIITVISIVVIISSSIIMFVPAPGTSRMWRTSARVFLVIYVIILKYVMLYYVDVCVPRARNKQNVEDQTTSLDKCND